MLRYCASAWECFVFLRFYYCCAVAVCCCCCCLFHFILISLNSSAPYFSCCLLATVVSTLLFFFPSLFYTFSVFFSVFTLFSHISLNAFGPRKQIMKRKKNTARNARKKHTRRPKQYGINSKWWPFPVAIIVAIWCCCCCCTQDAYVLLTMK